MSIQIYFVCSGTSCNDIINNINKNKETRHLQIRRQEIPLLDTIGVRQMYLAQQNIKIENDIIKNPRTRIFSTLDYDTIESTLVFNYSKASGDIYLLPLLVNNRNTRYYLQKIKELFGTRAETQKYWQHKNLNNQFINIKNQVSAISWTHIYKKIDTGNFDHMKNIIKDIFYNQYRALGFDFNYVVVCNYKLIVDILKNCRGTKKYLPKEHIVENSSIWEFDVSLDIYGNVVFNNFEKIYPKEQNFEPLRLNSSNRTFEYEFKGDKFPLYNPLKPLDNDFIKKLNFTRFSKEDRKLLKNTEENGKKNDTKNSKNRETRNNENNMIKKATFNNFLKL